MRPQIRIFDKEVFLQSNSAGGFISFMNTLRLCNLKDKGEWWEKLHGVPVAIYPEDDLGTPPDYPSFIIKREWTREARVVKISK